MSRFKKYALISLAFMIILYAVAVANPGTVLSRKACSSWSLVKDQAFLMTHPKLDGSLKLPANFTIQPGTAEQVPVLMYHYITPKAYNDQPDNNSIMNLEDFEAGIDYLYEQGYYTATMEELEQYVLGKATLPAKSVVITFDDGYQNNYTYAYPILKKYGFHAAIFLIGSRVQTETSVFDPAKKSFLSQEEIEASSDVFEYHSHTYDLHHKGFMKCGLNYASGFDTTSLESDIAKMKELGIDSPYFAYPYGEKSTPMVYYLQKNNYRMAMTVHQGFVKPGDSPMRLKRLTVTSATNMADLLQP
ncbi:polysaccharide deacetylase family protein [Paenibacillus bouchesdurhonensis]|uniref:polysaccharide deacetylase family protein n=1 Tax=Paenibacillus bouchesdurhonensis TaxID=1870990 RepID=UPI000DA60562|nr:polysaccharide deacetylase family protein [Paenibacillus bouchesdurhonensis]